MNEICDWVEILWKAGVEKGVEHALVHKTLKFCKSSHDKLESMNSRCAWLFYFHAMGLMPTCL